MDFLARLQVRFANGLTFSLEVLPTQALGRTGWLRPWRRDRQAFGVRTGQPGTTECWSFECWSAGMGVDFWRWLIRKPFRLGLVSRVSLPG